MTELPFPPRPTSFRGRARELSMLTALVRHDHPSTIALVGGGGSGKSTLAAALGHRLRRHFRGRVGWVRIGAWDPRTVLEMIALELGRPPGDHPDRAVLRAIGPEPALIVLDNHESDAATAAVLAKLRRAPVTWILTARRCLLGGVTIVPVVPPLIERREILFPRVAPLTRLLRWNAVALDIADGLVAAGVASCEALADALRAGGVERIRPMAHEDDVPEVRAVVLVALGALDARAKRMLAALAASRGDNVDSDALTAITGSRRGGSEALARLRELRLVQEPSPGRFALHATVRAAVVGTLRFDASRVALHYLARFEADPSSVTRDPTQLFALMDWAQEVGRVDLFVRVHPLLEALTASSSA